MYNNNNDLPSTALQYSLAHCFVVLLKIVDASTREFHIYIIYIYIHTNTNCAVSITRGWALIWISIGWEEVGGLWTWILIGPEMAAGFRICVVIDRWLWTWGVSSCVRRALISSCRPAMIWVTLRRARIVCKGQQTCQQHSHSLHLCIDKYIQ